MKKTFLLLACATALTAVSCNQDLNEPELPVAEQSNEYGMMSFSLNLGSKISTRAASEFVEMQDYEKQVNTIDLLVFDNAGVDLAENPNKGVTHGYLRVDNSSFTVDSENANKVNVTTKMKVLTGAKTVVAVINCPADIDLSTVANITDLKATAFQLEDNSLTASTGFVMTGEKEVTVTKDGDAAADITASRLTSRIALVSVTNNLPSTYGTLSIDRIFLTNVVGDQDLGGRSLSTTSWYNPMGRATAQPVVKTNILDGATHQASAPDLTYKGVSPNLDVVKGTPADLSSAPYLFYAFPNSTDKNPEAWTDSYEGAMTRLVLSALIDTDGSGTQEPTRFYYPVVIPAVAVNSTYDVSVTISGFGVTDPQQVIEKGAITASVTVNDWVPGEEISADF